MPENNLVERPVPRALRIAYVKRWMHRLVYSARMVKTVRFNRVSARFALPAVQMGNTAKHILTCHQAVVQFSQQAATSFDFTATVCPQSSPQAQRSFVRLTKAARLPDSGRNVWAGPRSGNLSEDFGASGDLGTIVVPG